MAANKKGATPKERLSARQRLFAEEYAQSRNASQAYRNAGYSAGNSTKQAASRLLTHVDVAAYVKELVDTASDKAQVNATWLLARLAEEATADAADLIDENGNLKSIHDWPEIWRKGLVSGVDIASTGEEGGTIVKVKLSDRVRRLELIGKHIDVAAFEERIAAKVTPLGDILSQIRSEDG